MIREYFNYSREQWQIAENARQQLISGPERIVLLSEFLKRMEPRYVDHQNLSAGFWRQRLTFAGILLNMIDAERMSIYPLPYNYLPYGAPLIDLQEVWRHEDSDKKYPFKSGGSIGDDRVDAYSDRALTAQKIIMGKSLTVTPCFKFSELMNCVCRTMFDYDLRFNQRVSAFIGQGNEVAGMFESLRDMGDYTRFFNATPAFAVNQR